MTTETTPQQSSSSNKSKVTLAVPLAFVVALFGLLYFALKTGEPQRLPSALIGKPIPDFKLPAVPKLLSDNGPVPGIASELFARGEVRVLNVWASWCAPCQAEHPQLVELARRVPLYGLNYKDKPEDARRFLSRFGNPFAAIGADTSGFTAIDFGVYGVPETFVIDGRGRVAYRFAGPLTPDVVAGKLMPAIAAARRERPPV